MTVRVPSLRLQTPLYIKRSGFDMESGHVSHALFLESHPVSHHNISVPSPSTIDRLAIFPLTPITRSLFLPIIFIQKFHRNISTFSPCTLPHCAGSPVEMHAANIPSGCEECVTECDVETCDLATESSQCTDRCLVVPCEDPCPDVCASACGSWSASPCETALCQGFHDLVSLFSPSPLHVKFTDHAVALTQSGHCAVPPPQGIHPLTQLPGHLVMQHERDGSDHLDWNNTFLSRELDALICACTTQPQPHSFDSNTCDPRLLSVTKSNAYSHHHSTIPRVSLQMSTSNTSGPVWFSPIMSATASARSSPGPSSPSTSDTQQLHTPEIGSRMDIEAFQSHPSDSVMCLWAQCGMTFRSSLDLISHVNAAHLHLPISPESFPHQIVSPPPAYPSVPQNPTSVACMWGDCNVYPTPSRIPGPSTGNVTHAALGLLASHLLQDHLGVSVPRSSTSKTAHEGTRVVNDTMQNGSARFHSPSNVPAPVAHPHSPPFTSQPLSSSSLNDVAQSAPHHVCKWQHCIHAQTIFGTSTDLTMHITDVHVGGGKNRYDCMWEGCTRHGISGFSSKQKILRHIQVCTTIINELY